MSLDVLINEYANDLLNEKAVEMKKQLKKRRTLHSITFDPNSQNAKEDEITALSLHPKFRDDLYKMLMNIIEDEEMESYEDKIKREIKYKELKGIRKTFRSIVYAVGAKRPEPYFLEAITMNGIEKVFIDYDLYPDEKRFLTARKYIILAWRY
jgi:hypothetical protein